MLGVCLAGCIAPVSQREAQSLASDSLKRFCRDQPCGATHLVAAQKIKQRWLVDFDAPGGKYTVIVEANGNAQVNVWDKNPAR